MSSFMIGGTVEWEKRTYKWEMFLTIIFYQLNFINWLLPTKGHFFVFIVINLDFGFIYKKTVLPALF